MQKTDEKSRKNVEYMRKLTQSMKQIRWHQKFETIWQKMRKNSENLPKIHYHLWKLIKTWEIMLKNI